MSRWWLLSARHSWKRWTLQINTGPGSGLGWPLPAPGSHEINSAKLVAQHEEELPDNQSNPSVGPADSGDGGLSSFRGS